MNNYEEYVKDLNEMLTRARTLGLWKTAKKVHKALREAEDEIFEVGNMIHVEFKIGPVVNQK